MKQKTIVLIGFLIVNNVAISCAKPAIAIATVLPVKPTPPAPNSNPAQSIAPTALVVSPTPLVEEPPVPTNTLYEAAKRYNEAAVYAILNESGPDREKKLAEAITYADKVKCDAQTTLNLVEIQLDMRKSWHARHYRIATFLVPLGAALLGAIAGTLYHKYWQDCQKCPKNCANPEPKPSFDSAIKSVELPSETNETSPCAPESDQGA